MTVRIVELSPEWEPRWEQFARAHPAGLVYYSLRFRDFLTGLLECRVRYGLACSGDRIEGVFPLLVTNGPYGEVLNALPYYGSPGSPLVSSDTAADALAAWYATQVGSADAAAGTVVANVFDRRPTAIVHDLTDTRVNHTTELAGLDDDDHLAGVVEASARRNVKKALRAGVRVAVENDNLDDLEELHVRSMELAGGVAKSSAFFDSVRTHFRPDEDFRVYTGRLDGRTVACLLLFYYAGTVEYYVPAVDPEHRSLQPLAAILRQAIGDAARQGARRWNWGGSWQSQDSLMRFKAKWGGQPRDYSYFVKVNEPALMTADPDELLDAYPGFYVRPFGAPATVGGAR